MLNSLFKLLVYRFAGARILLALSALGWVRRRLGSRRPQRATLPDRQTAQDYSSPS